MSAELTNFLPDERLRAQRRDYRFRLWTLAALGIGILAVVHGILLIPSYLYLSDKAATEQNRLTELSAADSSTDGASASVRLKNADRDAGRLLALASSTPASDLLRAILQVPHPGISLISISYDAGTDSRLILTGTAGTRDSLRAFDLALTALPYVANADLPLSAFAKENDIPFTVTLTGTLNP